MAEILNNQPIMFGLEPDCWLEDSDIVVLAEYGDITQFQMALEPCGSDVNVIQNGNFDGSTHWNTGGTWSISNGQACHNGNIISSLVQSASVADGVVLRMTFDIDIDSGGVFLEYGTYTEFFTESGSYTRWITAENATNFSFFALGTTDVCVSNIQVMTINTTFAVGIVDVDNNVIETLDTNDGYFNFTNGYFTTSIDWETLSIPDGCYTLGLFDPCPCSQGGIVVLDFHTATYIWSTSLYWKISGGVATFDGSGVSDTSIFNVLCVGTEYTVTYTLTGMSPNEEFTAKLGTSAGATNTMDGTFTENITCTGNATFTMFGDSLVGTNDFEVTDMSIEIANKQFTHTSNVIKVSDNGFDCNAIALSMCNDSDAFGFGFVNTGFVPLMRLPASLNRSNYPMERLSYDNSIGRKSTYYARSRKAQELGFDGKEFMHDFAHLFGMCDHFYIDNVEHAVEDDEYPSIAWSDGDDSGGVTINVSKKVQLIENRRLSSASVGCEVGGSTLLDDDLVPITDQTDSPISTP